jgi:hypothetical protein
MLDQTRTSFSHLIISGVVDLVLMFGLLSGKLRHRPTTFMKSGRPKFVIFKFKAWPQKRSQNLSCNLAQTFLRSLSIDGVIESQMTLYLVGEKIR